jgi:exo-1,4-beta-D-glucosaminidase
VPPNYWEEGAATGQLGGAFGFSTEISPGAAPLLLDAATRYLGQDHLWPVDDVWDYHCGSEQGLFGSLGFFQPPLLAHYGNVSSAAAFLSLSQAQAYDAHRAMFESYAAFKYNNATGTPGICALVPLALLLQPTPFSRPPPSIPLCQASCNGC